MRNPLFCAITSARNFIHRDGTATKEQGDVDELMRSKNVPLFPEESVQVMA